MTQLQIVANKLAKDGEVTRNWALSQFISRLSAIIYTLKYDYSWEIDGSWISYKGKDGKTYRDYKYKLLKKGKEIR